MGCKRSTGAQRRVSARKEDDSRLWERDKHGGLQEKGRGHPDPPLWAVSVVCNLGFYGQGL